MTTRNGTGSPENPFRDAVSWPPTPSSRGLQAWRCFLLTAGGLEVRFILLWQLRRKTLYVSVVHADGMVIWSDRIGHKRDVPSVRFQRAPWRKRLHGGSISSLGRSSIRQKRKLSQGMLVLRHARSSRSSLAPPGCWIENSSNDNYRHPSPRQSCWKSVRPGPGRHRAHRLGRRNPRGAACGRFPDCRASSAGPAVARRAGNAPATSRVVRVPARSETVCAPWSVAAAAHWTTLLLKAVVSQWRRVIHGAWWWATRPAPLWPGGELPTTAKHPVGNPCSTLLP